MPTPSVAPEVSELRKTTIEACLREGYAPYRQAGGLGSSIGEAARRLSMKDTALGSWVQRQETNKARGQDHWLPNWSLAGLGPGAAAATALRQASVSPHVTEGFIVRELTKAYDGEGEETGSWVREGPEPLHGHGGIGEGPERDGHGAYFIKGVSTYFGADGTQRGQWVKTAIDRQRFEAQIREFVAWLVEEARGQSPLVPPPDFADDDLLAVYPMGDPHFGMYAWAEEAGEDFDLEVAQEITFRAIDRLVAAAPPARRALLLNLGDFFHADNHKNQTPTSGNPLDVDTRHAKVMQVGLRAVVHCVNRLKEKHEIVYAWMMPGNHDEVSSFALALALDAFFSNDERVQVDLAPSLYKYMRFGANLIGSHHGHGAKMGELPGIMATDCPEDWGETAYRFWYCGHIHHKAKDKEHPGCMVETFNTLAPGDAWHAGKGYRAARNMQCIVHHRTEGEVERHTFNVPRSRRKRAIAA